MTPNAALDRSVSLLGEAAETLAKVNLRDVPQVHRQIFRATAEVLRVAHAYVDSAVSLGEFAELPAPRSAPGVRRGPTPVQGVEAWRDAMAAHDLGPLQTPVEAAVALGISEGEVLRRIEGGLLPGYRLGQAIVRTRVYAVGADARAEYLADNLVGADSAAAYLAVPRKWIYNHSAELPRYEGPTGAASFSIIELEWYLETFVRSH